MPKIIDQSIDVTTYLENKSFIDFYNERKKILILRNTGGLGDIFMHRMIFEDFKLLMPDCHITFACPPKYFNAVSDHPFIDEIIDCKNVKYCSKKQPLIKFITGYGEVYDTSFICNRYEMKMSPYCYKHRCDIWAEDAPSIAPRLVNQEGELPICGLKLTNHNMHFTISDEEKQWAKDFLRTDDRKIIIFAPVSAMNSKNMEPHQIQPVIDALSKDYKVYALHDLPIPQYNIPSISCANIRQFIALLNEVDCVISVDTAAFHCAGGLGKPTLAIFGWADGKVYSKYYPRVVLVQKHREDNPEWTCGPCYKFTSCCKVPETVSRKPCITEITSDMIMEGFYKLRDKYW